MILDTLENLGCYERVHSALPRALAFLRRPDLKELAPGRHELDGERVYAMIACGPGRTRAEGLLEVHRRYIDIQLVLSGTDEMGWKPLADCRQPSGVYDPDSDAQLFADTPDAWVLVGPGQFALFLPEDAHLPMVGDGEILKAIAKIAVPDRG